MGRLHSATEAITDATAIFDKINSSFQPVYGVALDEALHKAPKVNLRLKESRAEKKRAAREDARKHKRKIEENLHKSDVDVFLGCRQSYAQRQKIRLATYFETPQAAHERTEKRKRLEEQGMRKKKRHASCWQDIDFDKEGLLQEVKQTPEGSKVSKFNPLFHHSFI